MNWASVVCRVQGLDVHSFLAKLTACGVPVRQLRRTGFSLQLTVAARHYRRACIWLFPPMVRARRASLR